jgi:hypothetical protein
VPSDERAAETGRGEKFSIEFVACVKKWPRRCRFFLPQPSHSHHDDHPESRYRRGFPGSSVKPLNP